MLLIVNWIDANYKSNEKIQIGFDESNCKVEIKKKPLFKIPYYEILFSHLYESKEEEKVNSKSQNNHNGIHNSESEDSQVDLFLDSNKDVFLGNKSYSLLLPQNTDEELYNSFFKFAEIEISSNLIYYEWKRMKLRSYIGSMDCYLVGNILKYLDYRTIMLTIGYLNKSFMCFIREMLLYVPNLERKSTLKVDLYAVFQGFTKVPLLRHPYYMNCQTLDLFTVECKSSILDHNQFEKWLMMDLFQKEGQFPHINELIVSVSPTYSYLDEGDSNSITFILWQIDQETTENTYLQYITRSKYLPTLQKLCIKDARTDTDFNMLFYLSDSNFPNLTELDIPYAAVERLSFDYTLNGFPQGLSLTLTYFIYPTSCKQIFYNVVLLYFSFLRSKIDSLLIKI